MTDILSLDEGYSTTRLLTQEKPQIINTPEDKFETVLFLPEGENRKGEGGLRTKGYFKKSFDDKPLISIITVVFNGEKYLEETIQSVINQTYSNVEYIIIDGGSTDGTLDIIKKYEDQIDYWVSEKDKGIYDAMNKGWSLINLNSKILFLGAGDTILSLPSQKLLLSHDNYVIYGKVKLENSTFNSNHGWKLNLGNTLHHQALLVPKILHQSPPFNINYPTYADYDFNLRLYKTGSKFVYTDSFIGYAMPDGVSAKLKILEMSHISMKNSGFFWQSLSFFYCSYQFLRIEINKFFKR